MEIQTREVKQNNGSNPDHGKILLVLLPYWTPLIPPMGIACLSRFLKKNDFNVKVEDANIMDVFKDIYNRYFDILQKIVPGDKRGNFFSIGHDVLQNHFIAHLNYQSQQEFIEVVRLLVSKTFYCQVEERNILALNKTAAEFFVQLEKYIIDLLEKEKPSLLGLSVNSCVLPASLFALKLTRERYPGIKTVMGGGIFCDQLAVGTRNFEIFLEETKNYIDNIIIGEGELLFLKLLRGQLPDTQRVFTVKDINCRILDFSTNGVPDFTGFNTRLYPYLSGFASRGCPFQCSFCSDSVMWGRFRKKNPAQVAKELIELSKKHGYQLFMMSDLLLNPIISGLAKEFINSRESIYWDGCLRADKEACSIKNTQLWRRGGFYKARLGLESGSPRVLKLMGKKVTPGQIKEAISALAFAGIQTTTLWVIGHPGETEEDFQQTLDLIEELKDDIYEAECRPFYYYPAGQTASKKWEKESKHLPLYPPQAEKMLLFQTWVLDSLPSREETYQRVSRFAAHCSQLGIPNAYSLHDICKADERWHKLHKNAVPYLLEFKKKDACIDECKAFEETYFMEMSVKDEGDFDF